MSDDAATALDELLRSRWSCRAYLPDAVPRADIERILRTAQRSASWCNTQPWSTIVTSGTGTERFRAALAEHASSAGGAIAPDFDHPLPYEGVYRERRRESGWQLYDAVGVKRGDREASAHQSFQNFRLFGAPHVAIITTDARQGVYGAVDAGLYVGTFLLAAQSIGVATIPQAAIATFSPFLHDYFGIPSDRKVLLGISFGYPDREHPANSYRTSRADLDEVVTWIDD